MKNIIEEKPTDPLVGRTKFSTEFVSDEDIKGKIILDLGCGYGWFILNAVKRGAKKVIGMEQTEKDLETAKKYVRKKSVSLITGSALKIPLEKNSVDCIVSWDVLEHIPKGTERKMFKEIFRVLKPKGVAYLSTPCDVFFNKLFDPAWWLVGHRHYTPETISMIAKQASFKVEKLVVKGSWWSIFGILNLYTAKWIFRRRPFLQKYFNSKQNQEYDKPAGFETIFIKAKKVRLNMVN